MEPPSSIVLFTSSSIPAYDHWLALVALLPLTALATIMASSEAAFYTLRSSEVELLKGVESRSSSRILQLLAKPSHLLACLWLCGITVRLSILILLIHLLGIANGTYSLSSVHPIPILALIVIIMVLLVDALPRRLGSMRPMVCLAKSSFILSFAMWITRPILRFIGPSMENIKQLGTDNKHAIQSIESLSLAGDGGKAQTSEGMKILKAILDATDTEVREALCPRVDVTAVGIENDFKQICDIVVESAYSRIPVYEDKLDNIIGVLYIKDLLPHIRHSKPNFDWRNLIREAYFVPENKKINDLLEDFKQKRIHMAIVVDEYGGTVGLITMEDILEEVVGEILDESDLESDESYCEPTADGGYLFEGKTALNDFYRTMLVQNDLFDDIRGDAETLAGLLLEQLGELPDRGDQFQLKQFTFTVEEVDKRRILKIKVTNNDESRS